MKIHMHSELRMMLRGDEEPQRQRAPTPGADQGVSYVKRTARTQRKSPSPPDSGFFSSLTRINQSINQSVSQSISQSRASPPALRKTPTLRPLFSAMPYSKASDTVVSGVIAGEGLGSRGGDNGGGSIGSGYDGTQAGSDLYSSAGKDAGSLAEQDLYSSSESTKPKR